MPDVVGCVLSTRLKDDVLSVWNLSNRNSEARFRIGEKLKEVLDLDMNALIQYKDHMQSLQDYSTYRNAKNYMFAPSPAVTPLIGTLATPQHKFQEGDHADSDFEGMLPPAAIDTMLPSAAVDTEGFGFEKSRSPQNSASGAPYSPGLWAKSPPLSASAAPFSPTSERLKSPTMPTGDATGEDGKPRSMSWAAKAAANARVSPNSTPKATPKPKA